MPLRRAIELSGCEYRWELSSYQPQRVISRWGILQFLLCSPQTAQMLTLQKLLQQLDLISPDPSPVLSSFLPKVHSHTGNLLSHRHRVSLSLPPVINVAGFASRAQTLSGYCFAFSTRRTSASRLFEPGGTGDKRQECNYHGRMCRTPINGSLSLKEEYCRGGDDFQLPLLPSD